MKDFEIRCDESRLETTNLIYGKFTLGPFLPGQATTFGNALRRSLLAELSGLAITAFEIIGVMQEFSTLPGLRESILDLSLNLKQIVLTGVLPHSTPPIGFLNIRGPAIIKASDLKLPAGVYCASPNQYIATLGSNGTLHLKFIVSVGKGYSIQPYSIYRSLSKIRLQPASNFDNPSESFPLTKYQEKQIEENNKHVDSLTQNSPSSYSKGVGVSKLNFTSPAFAEETPIHTLNSDAFSYKSNKDFSTSFNSFDELTNQKRKREEFSRTDKLKLRERSSNNLETNSQTFNPLLTSKTKKALEDPLISFAHPNSSVCMQSKEGLVPESPSAFHTSKAEHRIEGDAKTPQLASLLRVQSKPLCVAQRLSKSRTANTSHKKAENLDLSQSTFFTNEKSSNYINIQTQLFQRITPHQVLPIDAVFTPVSQVNFLTEVNDRFETARENIVLEIWTNGSIHPKRALEEATLSLVQNFDTLLKKIQQASSFYKGLRYWTYLQPFRPSLVDYATKQGAPTDCSAKMNWLHNPSVAFAKQHVKEGEEPKAIEKSLKKDLPQSIYNLDIGNLNLSLQTFLFLKKAKIHTLLQLLTQFSLKQNNIFHLESFRDKAAPRVSLNDVNPQFQLKHTPLSTFGSLPKDSVSLDKEKDLSFKKEGKVNIKTNQDVKTDLNQTTFQVKNSFSKTKETNNNFLNEKMVEELNNVIRQFGFEG